MCLRLKPPISASTDLENTVRAGEAAWQLKRNVDVLVLAFDRERGVFGACNLQHSSERHRVQQQVMKGSSSRNGRY